MKININTTIELKPHEVEALNFWYFKSAHEGENFQDWIGKMAATSFLYMACAYKLKDQKQ